MPEVDVSTASMFAFTVTVSCADFRGMLTSSGRDAPTLTTRLQRHAYIEWQGRAHVDHDAFDRSDRKVRSLCDQSVFTRRNSFEVVTSISGCLHFPTEASGRVCQRNLGGGDYCMRRIVNGPVNRSALERLGETKRARR